jgi:hypothetical protein
MRNNQGQNWSQAGGQICGNIDDRLRIRPKKPERALKAVKIVK